jgi:hypothetical protein
VAITHVDGDFRPEHFSRDFGFNRSAEGGAKPPYAADKPTRGPKSVPEPMEMGGGDYARGGAVHPHGGHMVREEMRADGGRVCHMSHGGMTVEHQDGHITHHNHDGSEAYAEGGEASMGQMHPHGHGVTRVDHRADGAVVHHHDHGGHTVHHADGRITHHLADGRPASMAMGGIEGMHDSSEYVHRARGGFAGDPVRVPRSMKPMASRHRSPIGSDMPINKPPRNPTLTTSPHNAMPGGQMAYGVQPSAEPDMAGSEQGIPQMKRGGRMKG